MGLDEEDDVRVETLDVHNDDNEPSLKETDGKRNNAFDFLRILHG